MKERGGVTLLIINKGFEHTIISDVRRMHLEHSTNKPIHRLF